MRSSPSGSRVSLVFRHQEWWLGDDPVEVKLECKEVDPSAKTAKLYTFRLSGTIIDSEKRSITANRKLTMGF